MQISCYIDCVGFYWRQLFLVNPLVVSKTGSVHVVSITVTVIIIVVIIIITIITIHNIQLLGLRTRSSLESASSYLVGRKCAYCWLRQ
jgi:uncharacterized membrane protein